MNAINDMAVLSNKISLELYECSIKLREANADNERLTNLINYLNNDISHLHSQLDLREETIRKFSENAAIFKKMIDAAKYHAGKGHNKED